MITQQTSIFDPVPPENVDEALRRISAHGWDQVGHPAGKWKRRTFRRQSGIERGDDEYATLAEGELAMWLEDLDRRAMDRRLRGTTNRSFR